MNLNRTEEELVLAVKKLFGKRGCTDDSEKENNKNLNDIGRVFRVKGFMKNQSGDWMELNATTQKMTVNPIKEGQEILIVIGEDLKKTRFVSAWKTNALRERKMSEIQLPGSISETRRSAGTRTV